MNPKLVIFDLDGTLLDTLDDLSAAVNYAMLQRGFPQHTREEYRMMVGHGARNLMTKALPAEHRDNETLIDAVLADFRNYYNTHIDVFTKPFPGIPQLLERLHQKGIKLAVASNKFQEGTEHLIKEFFPEIPFVAILGNRPGYPLKPDPEVVGEVLRKTGLPKDNSSFYPGRGGEVNAVMVGDSDTDMETAANGGIRGIAVNWGYRNMRNWAKQQTVLPPDQEPHRFMVVDTVEELQNIILMPTETTSPSQNIIIWQDADRKLVVANGTPTLLYKGKTYTFSCQPYEPMAIIELNGKPVAYLHNAFNPDEECQMFIENHKHLVRTISGKHHDAERFCRLLSTAVEYGYDRNVDEAEDKMLELLAQEKGIATIQFETRDFHCEKVLFEGVYVLLGHFENKLSKANNIDKIHSIAFGYPDRNTDYFEYFFLTELQYRWFKELPERKQWRQKDDAWKWKYQHLDGKQVLCNEFSRNTATYKPYFRLDEVSNPEKIKIEYNRDSVCAADDYINKTLEIVLPSDAMICDLVDYIQHYNDDYGYSGIPYTGGGSWWALKSDKGILAYVNDDHNEVRYLKFDKDLPLKNLDIQKVYGTRDL